MSLLRPAMLRNCTLLPLLVFPALAAPVVYTDQTAFQTAAGGALTGFESFETLTLYSSPTYTLPLVTINCVGFCSVDDLYATDGTAIVGNTGSNSIAPTVTFSFASPITMFGVDILDFGTILTNSLTADLSNGSGVLFYSGVSGQAPGNARFAGVIDPAGFTSITFAWTSWNDYVGFDRMQVDLSATATPEPASGLLALASLMAVARYSQRRTRRQ